jgi:hypothetical protein
MIHCSSGPGLGSTGARGPRSLGTADRFPRGAGRRPVDSARCGRHRPVPPACIAARSDASTAAWRRASAAVFVVAFLVAAWQFWPSSGGATSARKSRSPTTASPGPSSPTRRRSAPTARSST